jgi:hypothetical protein
MKNVKQKCSSDVRSGILKSKYRIMIIFFTLLALPFSPDLLRSLTRLSVVLHRQPLWAQCFKSEIVGVQKELNIFIVIGDKVVKITTLASKLCNQI